MKCISKRYRATAAVMLPIVFGMALSVTSIAQAPLTKTWIDVYREATVSIGEVREVKEKQSDGSEKERRYFSQVGTGVIFNLDSDRKRGYLVTAKHIFVPPDASRAPGTLQIRFAWDEAKSFEEELGSPLRLRVDDKPLWTELPNADLACIELPSSEAFFRTKNVMAVSTSEIVALNEFFEGAPLVVIGYPAAVATAGDYLRRALVRHGAIAWISPADPLRLPFLIDAQVYPGNSGGPVLMVPTGLKRDGSFNIGGRVAFAGIVIQAPFEERPTRVGKSSFGFKSPTGDSLPVVSESRIGVGVVEPASRVKELVEAASKKSR